MRLPYYLRNDPTGGQKNKQADKSAHYQLLGQTKLIWLSLRAGIDNTGINNYNHRQNSTDWNNQTNVITVKLICQLLELGVRRRRAS